MSLTHDDVLAILKIIDESPYDEVRIEIGDLKVHVRRHGDGAALEPMQPLSRPPESPAQSSTESQPAAQASASSAAPSLREQAPTDDAAQPHLAEGLVAVRAPMLGTFYRAPTPGDPPFVEVGDKVSADDTVCLVEVMKLFSSVKAGVAGTVVKIAVENGSMVEHGQVMILIESDRHTADPAVQ
ncbi:MAG: acetyl-CoA carboxylase biotin carboxyl carrier protein [Betaproteobacteria bacterium]|nr:acetyl-CoA carboxylase biotin carboxyl carrier protein [Betaproteobacteria bacterium]